MFDQRPCCVFRLNKPALHEPVCQRCGCGDPMDSPVPSQCLIAVHVPSSRWQSAGTVAVLHVPCGASAGNMLLRPVPFHLPPCALPAAGAVLARGKPVSAQSPALQDVVVLHKSSQRNPSSLVAPAKLHPLPCPAGGGPLRVPGCPHVGGGTAQAGRGAHLQPGG